MFATARFAVTAAALAMALCACSGDAGDGPPKGEPTADRNKELRGFLYNDDAMVSEGNAFRWAQQVFAGYRPAAETDLPASVGALPVAPCRFEKPERTDAVHHVHVGSGTQKLPIFTFKPDDIETRAENFVNTYRRTKGQQPAYWPAAHIDAMSLVNVAVTETDKPVYLVLTSQSRTVWNINVAPGVQLKRIAIIAHDEVGVANVPEGVPVSAIADHQLSGCGLNPQQMPRDDWSFVQNVKGKSSSMGKILRDNIGYARSYSSWFFQNFRMTSHDTVAEALGVSNVLVGPAPADPTARIAYAPVKGATVLLSAHDNLLLGNRAAYDARNVELVTAAGKRLAGGDLRNLLPAS